MVCDICHHFAPKPCPSCGGKGFTPSGLTIPQVDKLIAFKHANDTAQPIKPHENLVLKKITKKTKTPFLGAIMGNKGELYLLYQVLENGNHLSDEALTACVLYGKHADKFEDQKPGYIAHLLHRQDVQRIANPEAIAQLIPTN